MRGRDRPGDTAGRPSCQSIVSGAVCRVHLLSHRELLLILRGLIWQPCTLAVLQIFTERLQQPVINTALILNNEII